MKYIDKAAVVAEITKRISERVEEIKIGDSKTRPIDGSVSVELISLLYFLDTLEVKEVDLEKEFETFLDNIEGVPRMWHSDEQIEWAKDIAKHFFELGLNTRKE